MLNQRVLIYTVALDKPGEDYFRHMAKILVSSLLRTYFTGEILAVHNGPAPLFLVERKGVQELMLPPGEEDGYKLKYRARRWIKGSSYDWVCFLDCDMLALRNIDHLFDPGAECDILWQPEGRMTDIAYNSFFRPEEYPRLWRYGANSGSYAVRGSQFETVMAEWERLDAEPAVSAKVLHDQPAWNRLLYDTPLSHRRFERGEIQFPLLMHHEYKKWRECALIHANAATKDVKLEFLMAQYLGRFAGAPQTMLSLLDI